MISYSIGVKWVQLSIECDICGTKGYFVAPVRKGDPSMSIVEIQLLFGFIALSDEPGVPMTQIQHLCSGCVADLDTGDDKPL